MARWRLRAASRRSSTGRAPAPQLLAPSTPQNTSPRRRHAAEWSGRSATISSAKLLSALSSHHLGLGRLWSSERRAYAPIITSAHTSEPRGARSTSRKYTRLACAESVESVPVKLVALVGVGASDGALDGASDGASDGAALLSAMEAAALRSSSYADEAALLARVPPLSQLPQR